MVLRSERRGSVLTLTLDRPEKRNALSAELVDALLDEIEHAGQVSTDVVVLRGEGPSFSGGFDLTGLDDESDGDLLLRFARIEELLQLVHHAPFATLALAHGRVVGAGADLVCACSHRIGAPASSFTLPGLAFGIVLGTRRLAVRVGADTALAIQAGGRSLDAEEALGLGFLTEVRPVEDWTHVVDATLRTGMRMSRGPGRQFNRALVGDHADGDLAALVRSAAVPGLAGRILDYAGRPLRAGQRSTTTTDIA
jgi:enoyl-CoA hydratase/carnithine racemase